MIVHYHVMFQNAFDARKLVMIDIGKTTQDAASHDPLTHSVHLDYNGAMTIAKMLAADVDVVACTFSDCRAGATIEEMLEHETNQG